MEILYKTKDGEIFTDKKQAQEHEATLGKFDMIGFSGRPCATTEEATVVILYDACSADAFLALAEKQKDDDVFGIEPGDEGVFLWERTGDGGYFPIEKSVKDALICGFAKYEEYALQHSRWTPDLVNDDDLPF